MALRDSIVGAITSGQNAVGSALTGGTAAVATNDNGAIPLLEDLRSITRENEGNTERLTNVLRDMFTFDKNRFARERDQARENRQEKAKAITSAEPGKGISASDLTGDMGMKGLAAIAGLAFFAKQLGMNTDILKLPQQIKSIKGMATFAKGVGSIATFGLGPKIIDDMKAAVKAVKVNPKAVQQSFDLFDDAVKTRNAGFFGKGGTIATSYTKTLDSIAKSFNGFKKSITTNRVFKTIADNFKEAKTTLQATFKPIKDALTGTGGLFASAKNGGALAKMIEPLKAIGKTIGKLFLPITLILGIFDGYTGFMEEYEKEKSFMDGIRGAITGIIDGFIGSFVRLATGAIGKGLEYLGLENVGKFIADFGEDITKSFKDTVGGLVDIVTGIFTLDLGRILGGIGATMSGLGNFLFDIVSLPINTAVNFVKDLFGFGNPDEPFSLKTFLFGGDGERGLIGKMIDMITDIFKLPEGGILKGIADKIFSIARLVKAIGLAGVAAAGALAPGGKSPGEAFKEKFAEVMSGGSGGQVTNEGDIVKTIEGDTSETTNKTEQLNETTNNNQGNITYVDNSNKQNQNIANSKNETYTGPLNTGIDPYHDRLSFYGIG